MMLSTGSTVGYCRCQKQIKRYDFRTLYVTARALPTGRFAVGARHRFRATFRCTRAATTRRGAGARFRVAATIPIGIPTTTFQMKRTH